MAIKISEADTQPALVYDHWFLNSLTLDQRSETHDNAIPYFTLKVQYQLFAIDEQGIRHFKNKINTLTIDNYVAVAMEKAANGDMDLIVAMQAIEQALAKVVENQTNLGTASVI